VTVTVFPLKQVIEKAGGKYRTLLKIFSDVCSENKHKFLISAALLEISGKAINLC